MGRWDTLTERQSQFLLQLADKSSRSRVESFVHHWSKTESDLYPTEGAASAETTLRDVPKEVVFYRSLEKLGFICLDVLYRTGDHQRTERQEVSLAVYKPVFEYAAYRRRSEFARTIADLLYDFGLGETALARTIWIVATAAIGAVVGAIVSHVVW